MTAATPPCLHCDTPRDEWDGPEHEFSPCCSDDCLALAKESGAYDPPEPVKLDDSTPAMSGIERVEVLLEKQLTYMEDRQRGPLPFVPSADTAALRDLVATLRDLRAMSLEGF